jgi:cytochrome P450
MEQIIASDLLAQETMRDPHTFYGRLREQGPLFYIPDLYGMGRVWIATNYDDAIAIMKDPRFTKDRRKVEDEQPAAQESISPIEMRSMLNVDPPDHTRLRALVSKAFTPRMIAQLRPRIQQITDELLDAVQEQGRMDIIADFAYPLPITVISEMLGIPAEDRSRFRAWTQAMLSVSDQPGQEEVRAAAAKAFLDYIKTLLEEKRTNPASDLTSALIGVEENGDQLNENELISMIWLLLLAGHETTVNLIGNGALALLQHPEQMQRLQGDPSLLPTAIEEILRYTAPVSLSDERWASEDIPMHGEVIRKGDMVLASLAAVNTDPRQFPDPKVLDLARKENQHLSFGKGIHYCLGAPLARLEGQIAFGTLLQRLPNLRLASDPAQLIWNSNPMLRGLKSLPVMF